MQKALFTAITAALQALICVHAYQLGQEGKIKDWCIRRMTYVLAQVKLVQDWVVSRVICALAQVNTDCLRDAGQTVSWVAGAGFTCREAAATEGTKRSQNPRSIPDLAA